MADPDRDAVLVMNCPVAVADSLDAAKAVVDALPPDNDLPILTCWLGEPAARESRKLFSEKKIPTYDTPDEAVHAFMHLVQYQRNQELLRETPAGVDLAHPDRDVARATIRGALAEGRKLLSEPEAKTLLSAYGIPTVQVIAPPPTRPRPAASRRRWAARWSSRSCRPTSRTSPMSAASASTCAPARASRRLPTRC